MPNTLAQLKSFTTIVADTGDIEAIKRYQPEDATTNPSLILKASQIPEYAFLIENAIEWAKTQSQGIEQQVEDAGDKLAVNIGVEIL
ncbi:transaldolase, partial [Shewanella sp. SG41-4]|uniref:transaldolase family protein n=1 Tax=Shewanella sp. SG41-4 TaxID=2760976 RepID=UPI0017BDECF7